MHLSPASPAPSSSHNIQYKRMYNLRWAGVKLSNQQYFFFFFTLLLVHGMVQLLIVNNVTRPYHAWNDQFNFRAGNMAWRARNLQSALMEGSGPIPITCGNGNANPPRFNPSFSFRFILKIDFQTISSKSTPYLIDLLVQLKSWIKFFFFFRKWRLKHQPPAFIEVWKYLQVRGREFMEK